MKKVQVLQIDLHSDLSSHTFREFPVSMLSTSLVSPRLIVLKLRCISIKSRVGLEGLRLLRVLHLCDVGVDQKTFEELLSGCSLLMSLTLDSVHGVQYIASKSSALTNLKVVSSKLSLDLSSLKLVSLVFDTEVSSIVFGDTQTLTYIGHRALSSSCQLPRLRMLKGLSLQLNCGTPDSVENTFKMVISCLEL